MTSVPVEVDLDLTIWYHPRSIIYLNVEAIDVAVN